MPTRRDVLRGLAGGAAALATGLILPDRELVVPEVEAVKRYWSLDRTMLRRDDVFWDNGWHMIGDYRMPEIVIDPTLPEGVIVFTDYHTMTALPESLALFFRPHPSRKPILL